MKKLLCLLIFAFLSLSACDDATTELEQDGYMIFGRYAGFCVGDCFTVFKVTPSDLVEDQTSEHFTGDSYEFVPGRVLSTTELGLAKVLLSKIPQELLLTDKEAYGCPDCADQGGFYISFSLQGVEKSLRLDTRQTDDQSQEILTFKEQLSEVIETIR